MLMSAICAVIPNRGETQQVLPGVSALKRKKVLRALRDVSAIPRKTLDADTRRAATRLLQAASPLCHRMVRNTRELLRRYNLPVPKRDPREVVVEMTPAETGYTLRRRLPVKHR